jgi:hypothetical protein
VSARHYQPQHNLLSLVALGTAVPSQAIGYGTPYDPTGVYRPFWDADGYDADPWLAPSVGAWGWGPDSPIIKFFDAVLQRAQQAGLTVREVDLFNEIRISWYPVTARLIYDNNTATAILQTLAACGRSPKPSKNGL